MTKAAVIKDSITLRLAYSFRGLVHYPQGKAIAVCSRYDAGEIDESYILI